MDNGMTLGQVSHNLRMYASTDCDAEGVSLLMVCADAIDFHLTQPAQAVDVEEPQLFRDLREWMRHCVSCCDEGEDFNVTRDQLVAFTTLGLMEKAGRGTWRPTEAGKSLATAPTRALAGEQAGWRVPVTQEYTTGHCENHKAPGGCQLHNLQCGWPKCDRQLAKGNKDA